MGWVWRDDDDSEELKSSSLDGEISDYQKTQNPNYYSSSPEAEVCATRTVVRSQCKTEEVEPGKFVRKCEKTEDVLRECLGKPSEVLKSNKEYTEDDVTDLVVKGSGPLGKFEGSPFQFPGLQSDIEGIERHFFNGINHFFEAAEDMKKSIFDIFGELHNGNPSSSSPSARRGIPIEGHPQVESSSKQRKPNSGDVDLSGLAREV